MRNSDGRLLTARIWQAYDSKSPPRQRPRTTWQWDSVRGGRLAHRSSRSPASSANSVRLAGNLFCADYAPCDGARESDQRTVVRLHHCPRSLSWIGLVRNHMQACVPSQVWAWESRQVLWCSMGSVPCKRACDNTEPLETSSPPDSVLCAGSKAKEFGTLNCLVVVARQLWRCGSFLSRKRSEPSTSEMYACDYSRLASGSVIWTLIAVHRVEMVYRLCYE